MAIPYDEVPQSVRDAHNRSDRVDVEVRRLRQEKRWRTKRWLSALFNDFVVYTKETLLELRRREWDTTKDPGIEGIVWRWHVEPGTGKRPENYLPNFECAGVKLWWGFELHDIAASVEFTPDSAVEWYYKCLTLVQEYSLAHEDDPLTCTCKEDGCETRGWGCKGECGCVYCREAYQEFLSVE